MESHVLLFPLKASVSIPNVTEMKTNMSLGLTLTRNLGTGGFLVSVHFPNPHSSQGPTGPALLTTPPIGSDLEV